jgi:hypothetical protein
MEMFTTNKIIAVEPMPAKSIKQTVMKGGLIGVAQKVELIGLKVILPSEDGRFLPGMKVYVRGDLSVESFSANIQEIEGVTFILLPENYIQLVAKQELKKREIING